MAKGVKRSRFPLICGSSFMLGFGPKVCAYKEEIKYFRSVAIAIVRVDEVEASMNDVIDVSMLSVISIKQINE